jgi:Bacterial Ig-like domain (group 2)
MQFPIKPIVCGDRMVKKSFLSLVVLCVLAFLPWQSHAQNPATDAGVSQPEVSSALQQDVSPPLRDMVQEPRSDAFRSKSFRRLSRQLSQTLVDPVLQGTAGSSVATAAGLNFAGVGNGDYGFVPNAAPPDTNGAVGATQYVQWVNESFAVFDKLTGALQHGPVSGNTLWSGFGGGCQNNNDGDPVVQYDKAANRWILTQFSVSTTPFLQCVAVSTTSDATGTYYRYAFAQPNFNDYPKLGVWPDAYYISLNMFSGNTFVGGRACAFDRTAMLAGAPATQICFQLSSTFGGLLPSDLDGATPPPAGSPNPFVAFGNDSTSLDIWKFHADFAAPANSTFAHTNISAPAFAAACSGGGTCIPQSGTSQKLDSLADRLMHRLAYRNFGDHESLVVNHAVTAGTSVGVRWYEIRGISGTPTVYQSGTYAPDSNYRWMGSIAMDKVGNIALGYSVSSSSIHPSISYTGRAPTDPLGTMQGENTILTGGGSQTVGLSRWGDYSAMTVDPTDDCTFFYTSEYLKANGIFNWSTRIASFKFPSCSGTPPVLTTITVTPASASVQTGATQQFTATGYDQFNNLISPPPSFGWSVSGGGTINSSTGLFSAGATSGGPFTVTASSGGVNGTASITVTSLPADFSLSVSPASQSVRRSSTATYTVTIQPANGFSGSVSLSLTGQPSGSAVTFAPNPASSTSTLTVTTLTSNTRKTYTLTLKGVSGSLNHTTSASLTVTK